MFIGCFYKGDKVSVTEHKTTCVYKDESQLLAITMKEVREGGCMILHNVTCDVVKESSN